MGRAVAVAVGFLLLGPILLLLGMAVLMNPAAEASCLPRASVASATSGAAPGETSRVVLPLPADTWVRTSGFGIRVHPITGERALHTGLDLAAPPDTPILAVADGRVTFAGPAAGYGNLVLIEHTVEAQLVVSGYAHMDVASILVGVGDQVTAAQHVADVGTSGSSNGPHLHFEIRPGGGTPADPEPWLAAHAAASVTREAIELSGCEPPPGPPPAVPGTVTGPAGMVEDPTSEGQITERTARILSQVRARFPSSAWACWSERPGNSSEHEIGRACDGTFGNAIGTAAAGASLELGWLVTNWLKANAGTLGVEYLIWQGRIWSVARDAEGWRSYDGGGMHDPNSVTGGHYDHLHFTAE